MRFKTLEEKAALINERKEQILNAAIKVFARKGFAGTLVDRVAELAKLGKGTIYRYFDNKQDLFVSTALRGIDDLTNLTLKEIEEGKNPLEKIEKAISAYLGFFEKNPDLINIVLHSPVELQQKIKKRYFKHYQDHLDKMVEIFNEGIKQGRIRKLDPRGAILILVNLLNGFIYTWGMEGRRYSLQNYVPGIIDIFFRGILPVDSQERTKPDNQESLT